MDRNSKIYFTAGRLLVALLFVCMGIDCFVSAGTLNNAVPTFMGAPALWVTLLGIGWLMVGGCFLLNLLPRAAAVVATVSIMLILAMSTYRGFASADAFIPTVLSFAFYFAFMGCAMMIGWPAQRVFRLACPAIEDLFYAGRILMGIFFFTAGWLHFDNIKGDAAMMGNFPGSVFWVVFIGICWFAVSFSFFTNIMARTAGTLASLVLILIILVINFKSFGKADAWSVVYQIVRTLGVMGGCLLVASRGYYGLHVKSWWWPPVKWGWDLPKPESIESVK